MYCLYAAWCSLSSGNLTFMAGSSSHCVNITKTITAVATIWDKHLQKCFQDHLVTLTWETESIFLPSPQDKRSSCLNLTLSCPPNVLNHCQVTRPVIVIDTTTHSKECPLTPNSNHLFPRATWGSPSSLHPTPGEIFLQIPPDPNILTDLAHDLNCNSYLYLLPQHHWPPWLSTGLLITLIITIKCPICLSQITLWSCF